MPYVRPITFRAGTFLKPCDVCGIRFRADELVRSDDGRFRCIRWCQEQTQFGRDKIAAESAKRLREAPPPPHGVPYQRKGSYPEEATPFNFMTVSPVRDSGWTIGTPGKRLGALPADAFAIFGRNQITAALYSLQAAGEGMRYLYQVITENARPTAWIRRATTKLRELADYVYSQQLGLGVLPSVTKASNITFGSMFTGTTLTSVDHGRLGIGMLYAYKTFGDARYLASARGFADFLTNLQQGGLATFPSTSDPAGTSRISYGTWTRSCTSSGLQFDHCYQPDSLVCLEFLSNLLAITGDELHGSNATPLGLSFVPQQLLSTSIAKARAFWSVGAFDAVTGTTFTGLSATTPREFFNSYPTTKNPFAAGTGSWQYQDGPSATGTLITGSNFALALRSLFGFEGYSTTVSSIWTWLMGFASNPAFAPTSRSLAADAPTLGSLLGTYNPKLCLSTLLTVMTAARAAAAMNGSSLYDWQCAGMLAPIQGVQDSGSLTTAKDFVTKGVEVFPLDDYAPGGAYAADSMLCAGTCGLSGQMHAPTTTAFTWSAALAATAAQMFRFGVTAFPLQV